jgi:hypothetical protein
MLKKILPLFLPVIFLSDCRKNNDCQESKEFPKIDGWLIESIPPPKNVYDIVDFSFTSSSKGVVSSVSDEVFYTINKGYSWEKINYEKLPNHKLGAYSFNSDGIICMTQDSVVPNGLSYPKFMELNSTGWEVTPINVKGKFKAIHFAVPVTGCAIIQKQNGSFGLFYTKDKGKTWLPSTDINLGTQTVPKWQQYVLDWFTLYIMDAQSKIWKTKDGGITWLPLVEFTNTKIHQFQIINNEEDIVYTDDVGLALYRQGKPLERLSENSTNLLFLATNGAGITIQVPLDCANFDKSRNFGFERRCLFGSRANATNWVQSENYWYLNNWITKQVDEREAICTYNRYIYFIKYLN